MMDFLQNWLIAPLSLDFMQRALLIATMIGIVCSVFSCFLVLKGWSLMGDAVSHAVLPGLAIAYLLGAPLALGAFAAGIFCAGSIGYIKENSRVKEDTVMGVVFSGMFALGLVMLTKIETDVHLLHVLFGDVLGISTRDLLETGMITGFATTVMLLKRRDLMLYCFDPAHAGVIGLNTRLLHFGLLALLALTIVASLKAAGIILVVAMLIAPGAIGFLLTTSFDKMLAIAAGVSVSSCLLGTITSFHLDVATSPLIVTFQFVIFLLVLGYTLATPRHRKGIA